MLQKCNLQPYWFTRQVVTDGGDYPIPPYTNSVLVVNIGSILARINGFPINPPLVVGANGESWGSGGNLGEVLAEEQIEILFEGSTGGMVFLQFKRYTQIING